MNKVKGLIPLQSRGASSLPSSSRLASLGHIIKVIYWQLTLPGGHLGPRVFWNSLLRSMIKWGQLLALKYLCWEQMSVRIKSFVCGGFRLKKKMCALMKSTYILFTKLNLRMNMVNWFMRFKTNTPEIQIDNTALIKWRMHLPG